jgi:UDP-N-acetylmuramate dehydrogenase
MLSFSENISLKPYNTFGIDAKARWFTEIHTIEDLQEIYKSADFQQMPKLILGGGSNVLFSKNFEGLVMLMQIKGIQKVAEDEKYIWLKAGAGENWHQFVLYAVENNLGGIENLSLIPGTVGAAPIQNIGAYGTEVREVIESVEIFSPETQQLQILSNQQCHFGYRDSIFKNEYKGRFFITSVTFRLLKNPVKFNIAYGDIQKTLEIMNISQPNLKAISNAVIQIRQSKLPDPQQVGNAGSFFKNPEIPKNQFDSLKKVYPDLPGYVVSDTVMKVPAGWLIEQTGWKGRRIGEAGVHDRQALVLVNYGNATGEAIMTLAMQIRQSVQDKFSIILNPEVNFI